MYFLKQLHEHEIKGTFFIFFLNIGSEVEFLISSGTLFQSWLAQYAMLSKPNFFVLGFWDWNIWEFLRLHVFPLSWKMSLMISGDRPFGYLYLNHKEFYAFLVDWFFIWILKKYLEIRGVVLSNEAQASFMYAVNSSNRMFCAKHP